MAKKPKTEVSTETQSFGVNLAEVEHLLTFMQSHGLEELEYQRGDLHVRLKKSSAVRVTSPAPRAEETAVARMAHHGTAPAPQPAPVASGAQPQTESVHTIKSPIVGTFYAAPSPEADPFVTMGAHVETGQVLCIIEAMKLMNEIESDVAGEIVRIYVENGKPVEYGALLFDIRPRHAKK
jgi:acetyl-CoA carboxylase biotin carboxyl carrier protein